MPHFLIQEYLQSAVGKTDVIEAKDMDAAWKECHERMDWTRWYVVYECDKEGRYTGPEGAQDQAEGPKGPQDKPEEEGP